MRDLLASFPEAERRASRAAGYELAGKTLEANVDGVRRIADALTKMWNITNPIARIDGDKLAGLLLGSAAPLR